MLETKPEYIVHLANFVADEKDPRFYLHGFFAEPHPDGGAALVATDGRTLLAIHDEDATIGEAAIYPISRELLRAARDKRAVQVSFAENVARVRKADSRPSIIVDAKPIDGKYPQWAMVAGPCIEAAEVMQTSCCIDVQLLARLKCFQLPDKEAKCGVILRTVSAEGAMIFLPDRYPNMWGLIVPMRGFRGLDDIAPVWLARLLPKKAT